MAQFVESKTNVWVDLHNPATNEVVTRVPKATQDEMLEAVESAKAAFKPWSQTVFLGRQQVMFRYQNITKENMMFHMDIVCGNTDVIKPSERDPGACMMLGEMLKEAGCPNGVVNVIHGAHEAVNIVCDNPDIRAISFVGSDQAGKYIYERGSKNGKRVQCNMGSKNH